MHAFYMVKRSQNGTDLLKPDLIGPNKLKFLTLIDLTNCFGSDKLN